MTSMVMCELRSLPLLPAVVATPYRPACWLEGPGFRLPGVLEKVAEDVWAVSGLDGGALARLAALRHVGLKLQCDASTYRRTGFHPMQVNGFTIEEEAGRLLFRCTDPLRVGAKPHHFKEEVPGTLRLASLDGRVLQAGITAASPFEVLVRAYDPDGYLVPGSITTLEVARPWGGAFRIDAHVCYRADDATASRLVLRPTGRRSVAEAGWLTVCESESFGVRQLKMHGLSVRETKRYLTVSRAHGAAMDTVIALRRTANEFFGRRPSAEDDTPWADDLDVASVNLLAWIGPKPVGTGRVVLNGGNLNLSEIHAAVELPSWITSKRFVEISRVAIHPDFRSSGLMVMLFREISSSKLG